MIPIFDFNTPKFSRYLKKINLRSVAVNAEVQPLVFQIIEQVRKRGDEALLDYTRKYDGTALKNLRISQGEIHSLAKSADRELLKVIRQAAKNIRRYHRHQVEKSWEFETSDGVRLGQRISRSSIRGPLRSRRNCRLSVDGSHECHSRTNCRS